MITLSLEEAARMKKTRTRNPNVERLVAEHRAALRGGFKSTKEARAANTRIVLEKLDRRLAELKKGRHGG